MQIGIAAGDAGGSRKGQSGGTAVGNEPPFRAGERCEPGAYGFGQLVEMTYFWAAGSIAARTSGSIVEPLIIVKSRAR